MTDSEYSDHTIYKNVMITRSRQRVTKMATVSVNMERYNEDEVGVSYIWWWKGSVVWSMSKSRSGCVLMCRRGSDWLCRGEGGGGHSSAHGTHSTQQVVTNKKYYMYTHKHGQVVCVCVHVCVRACVHGCGCAHAQH